MPRIASLIHSATEIVAALSHADALVGRSPEATVQKLRRDAGFGDLTPLPSVP